MTGPELRGWCGWCGAGFAVAEVLRAGWVGRCPACGRAFAPSYDALMVGLLRQLLEAGIDPRSVADLAAMAPRLHIAAEPALGAPTASPGQAGR